MDGCGGFDVLFANTSSANFCVHFAPERYGRAPHTDRKLEDGIESRWQAALARNPSMFNGTKFRYSDCNYSATENTLTLMLGKTDYRTFQGTHGVSRPLETFGIAALARPLGNTIIVETSDACVALLHRAGRVGEGEGTAVFPGGHPEPDEMQLGADVEGEGVDKIVCEELWNAAWREVLEELFLEKEQTGAAKGMRCLGLVARSRDAKVCQVFYMHVTVDAHTVREQYVKGNVREEESCGLFLIPVDELRCVYDEGAFRGLRLMPECMGALELWIDFKSRSSAERKKEG